MSTSTPSTDRARATGHASLLPDVVVVESTTTDVDVDVLLAPELAAVARAVPARRAEFATGRWCARRALGRLGHPPLPLVPGPHREPRWPAGVVGSLTHCPGYRAAAVAHARDLLTLGIDVEAHAPLPEGVSDLVTVADEPERLAALRRVDPTTAWDRVLFSAKESIFKAWFPLVRTWLDFRECDLTIDPGGRFSGRLLVASPEVAGRRLERLTGAWAVRGDLVLTACWEPVDPVAHDG